MPEKNPYIVFTKHTPYIVMDVDTIIDENHQKLKASSVVALCRCGKSSAQPYCDDIHAVDGLREEKSKDRAPDHLKDYIGDDITVHFNLGVCCHDGCCVEKLPQVFDINKKPWIQPNNGKIKDIINIVEGCPSGALSYSIGSRRYQDLDRPPSIHIQKDGPIEIKGFIKLKDDENTVPACKEHYTLCRCSSSKNKPFCDGAHLDGNFE
ncbi:CDGSH iron-sulfur domain-containing protein [Anaerosolibacter carboniphilus]|nr:CDGSH iron-sulfur domain-containing protein [Anaerosolibacter carboniphilus]